MRKHLALVCAGGLLLMTMGCLPLQRQVDVSSAALVRDDGGQTTGQVLMMEGSVAQAAIQTEVALHRLGLQVQATQDGENHYLSSTSPTGHRFTLTLMHDRTTEGDNTQLRITWETDHDEQLWTDLGVNGQDALMWTDLLRILLKPTPVPEKASGAIESPLVPDRVDGAIQ